MLSKVFDKWWTVAVLLVAAMFCAQLSRSQDEPAVKSVNEWVVPDLPDALHAQLCHKDFLRFWRIKASGGTGNWHLCNEEDKAFLSRWKEAVQWTALEGKLPK